jgi:hypothetical protein
MAIDNENGSAELVELRREVLRQWLINHAEHCGVIVPPLPHGGDCQWPIPAVLLATSRSDLYLLLLEVSGESFGLRL